RRSRSLQSAIGDRVVLPPQTLRPVGKQTDQSRARNHKHLDHASRCVTGFLSQVALTGADVRAGLRDAHDQRMHLPVERLWRETERVLMMQLVGNTTERLGQIIGGGQLEISAAGCRGDLRQSLVRLVIHDKGTSAAEPAAWAAPPATATAPARRAPA